MVQRKRGSFGVKWGVCPVSREGQRVGREREREGGKEREGGREEEREGGKEGEREGGREGGRERGFVRYRTVPYRYGRYRVPGTVSSRGLNYVSRGS